MLSSISLPHRLLLWAVNIVAFPPTNTPQATPLNLGTGLANPAYLPFAVSSIVSSISSVNGENAWRVPRGEARVHPDIWTTNCHTLVISHLHGTSD